MIEDLAFRPDTLRIPPGTTVVFANQGRYPHTATESGGLFDSGVLAPGERFRYTFALPREYSVYCKRSIPTWRSRLLSVLEKRKGSQRKS